MAKILDLNLSFPADKDGHHGPLPKQQAFLDKLLSPHGPPYVMYSGGVGSGKTLIGCIATLVLALRYPGDYLVARQYMPELKLTTYRTFLDVLPKELIVEHRVADMILRVKSADGGVSNIIFRGLDEPDKLRSLNLNAAYIDEACQVSEEAFTLLQSRLRGKYVRKLYATTNPNGHSWLYRLFVKKDLPTEEAKKRFYYIGATSLENVHLPEDYTRAMIETWSEDRIQREVMGSWDAFEGQVYTEFSRSSHVIKPFVIPQGWTRWVGADHGYRNPACFLWLAKDYDDNVYVYREYYESGRIIKDICADIQRVNVGDKIDGIWIDPSTKADRGKESDWITYLEHLPKDMALLPANNEVSTGIDQVKQLLKVDINTHKPKLYIFDTCHHLLEELVSYKYEELTPGQEVMKNTKESPVKKNDHSCDALRYAVMAKADAPKKGDAKRLKMKENTLQGSVMRDFERAKGHGVQKDPWGDIFHDNTDAE